MKVSLRTLKLYYIPPFRGEEQSLLIIQKQYLYLKKIRRGETPDKVSYECLSINILEDILLQDTRVHLPHFGLRFSNPQIQQALNSIST